MHSLMNQRTEKSKFRKNSREYSLSWGGCEHRSKISKQFIQKQTITVPRATKTTEDTSGSLTSAGAEGNKNVLIVFTYCRWGVSITEDMNIGRFLIWRLNPKTAFCWKPSLMLRIYWFWSVMNRTSLRPLELASSMSFTTGCGGAEK